MNDIFEKEFEKFTWKQLACRIPSKIAVSVIKKRIGSDINGVLDFFTNIGNTAKSDELKKYVSEIVRVSDRDKVYDLFNEKTERFFRYWLEDDLISDFKNNSGKASLKFIFNSFNPEVKDEVFKVLDLLLKEEKVNTGAVTSVINKSSNFVKELLDIIVSDSREEVKMVVLCIKEYFVKNGDVSDYHIKSALKAMAASVDKLVWPAYALESRHFNLLDGQEKIDAFVNYLKVFPKNKGLLVLKDKVSAEELDSCLKLGSVVGVEQLNKIVETYREVISVE